MLVGVQETLTDVMVGDAVVVLPPPPLLPPQPANPANPKASTNVQKALCPNMSHHRGEIRPRNIKHCQCETIIL
jgi:hypothetical protein